MDIFNWVISIAAENPIIVSFLVGLLTGEETVMALSFASAVGVLPFWIVLVFATLGMFVCDTFFFAVGKSRFAHRVLEFKKIKEGYKKIDESVEKITLKHPILLLLYTKFIYGTRIASLLFLGIKQTSWIKFLSVNLAIAMLWGLIVIPAGWLAGKGFRIILDIFRNVQLGITFVVLTIILIIIIRKWLNKKLTRKQKQ